MEPYKKVFQTTLISFHQKVEEIGAAAGDVLGCGCMGTLLVIKLFAFLKEPRKTTELAIETPVSSEERDVIEYLAGFILRCIQRRCLRVSSEKEMLGKVEELLSNEPNKLVQLKDRGGLLNASKFASEMVKNLELIFRTNPRFERLTFIKEVSARKAVHPLSQKCGEKFTNLFVNLFHKVRIHHQCRMIMSEFRSKNPSLKKSLRKELAMKGKTHPL